MLAFHQNKMLSRIFPVNRDKYCMWCLQRGQYGGMACLSRTNGCTGDLFNFYHALKNDGCSNLVTNLTFSKQNS